MVFRNSMKQFETASGNKSCMALFWCFQWWIGRSSHGEMIGSGELIHHGDAPGFHNSRDEAAGLPSKRNNEQNPSRSNPVAAVLCLNLKHLQVILQVMMPDESCSCTWTTHENRHIETAHDPESEVHQNTFWCALMRMDSAGRTNHPILQRTEVSIPQRITNLPTWSNLDLTRM